MVAGAHKPEGHVSRLIVPRSMWFLAFALITHSSAATAAESRCSELGSGCVCSEPLNASASFPANSNINPPDSTTKECGGGAPLVSTGGGAVVPEFGMPAGNSVNYVWRLDSPNFSYTNAILYGNTMTVPAGTLCTRLYQTFSSDFPELDTPSRAKLQEFGIGGAYQQTEWYESGSSRLADAFVMFGIDQSVGSFGVPNPGTQTGPIIHLSDCRSSWCRVEQCLDVASTGTITGRVRITVLNTGAVETLTSAPAIHLGSANVDKVWIGNLYRQNSSAGYRYISHGMEAFWSTPSASNWIGKAYEVEGGGSTAPPPSGSQPPPAPTLLP